MNQANTPGPEHAIQIEGPGGRMRARFEGHVIADSVDAVLVKEAGYHPVYYFPREDVDMAYFARTDRRSHCPYKGEASYFTLRMEGVIAEDTAWSYENPYASMDVLRERVAFFPHPVEVYRVDEGSAPVSPDLVVRHTDAGEGTAQSDHWAPTVDGG